MLKEFENWLLNNNYRPTTAFDYQGRIERLCRKEGYTLSHLVENITSILPEYEINGKQSAYGKRTHTSVRQALRRFKMFLVSNNLNNEHDFGSFNYKGEQIYWKIDYYDKNYQYCSKDPSNPNITNRVMTIMLAEEY